MYFFFFNRVRFSASSSAKHTSICSSLGRETKRHFTIFLSKSCCPSCVGPTQQVQNVFKADSLKAAVFQFWKQKILGWKKVFFSSKDFFVSRLKWFLKRVKFVSFVVVAADVVTRVDVVGGAAAVPGVVVLNKKKKSLSQSCIVKPSLKDL